MRKLKAEHKIERVGSDRKGYWRIPKNQGYISSEPRAWKDKKGMKGEGAWYLRLPCQRSFVSLQDNGYLILQQLFFDFFIFAT